MNLTLHLINLYRGTAPLRHQIYSTIGLAPHSCKHSPSCSRYTQTAVNRYGTIRGLYLGFIRFLNCR